MRYLKPSNARFVSSVIVLIVSSMACESEGNHIMEKRQVGVLARSGALPQGKRSVEALARNGELPVPSSEKRGNAEEYVLDQLIRELGTAEGLSRMRVQALAEKLQSEEYEDAVGKRSVASLARNSELPQKRVVTHRSGYLIRPLHETEETDLLDPDDFLGKGGVDMLAVNGGFNVADGSLASFAKHGYGDEFGYDEYDDETDAIDKRHVGAARNFLFGGSSKRNLASLKNFLSSAGKRTVVNFGKRNVGAARNFLLSDKRNVGAFKNFLSTEKRNLGAARNFLLDEGKRNLGAARDFLYGKRNLASFARDGGFSSLRYPSMKDYDWDDVFDFDDFHEEEDKRNLGASRNFGKRSAPEKATSETPEKGKARTKRDAYLDAQTDEYPMPVLQASGELDYGDVEPLSNDLQKRFLGSVASWPMEQPYLGVTKRHIGALARLGWLPSFRTTRYSRSGRAINNRSMSPLRPNPSIGSCPSENANAIWSAPPSVETKVAVGPRGIFRRVGRSVSSLPAAERRY